MKNIDWKNLATRAAWTFAEGFFVTFFATANAGMDGAALKAALLGAAMAGLSALKTFTINLLQSANSIQGGEVK
jgi:hypothetical protein